jgi:hypothetical protein
MSKIIFILRRWFGKIPKKKKTIESKDRVWWKCNHESSTWNNIFDAMIIFKVYDLLFVKLSKISDVIISFY